MTDSTVGYYLIKALVARENMAGSPELHLTLGVDSTSGQANGSAEITQALPPPYGTTHVPQVTGSVRHLGFNNDLRVVAVKGQYVVSVPPPAIGSYLANFSAVLVLQPDGSGEGSFSYGDHDITGCTVTNEG
ncbi:MAG: DUF1842 domain-containing protein [Allosphingosinicella sp.]